MIGSYYVVGLTTLTYLSIPLIYLWFGAQPAVIFLADYLNHALPIGVLGAVIYRFAQRWLCDPVRERGWHWRGTLLKIGSWNVFLRGLVLAVRGVEVPYIPTRKERHRGKFWTLARVPLLTIGLSIITVAWTVIRQLFLVPESEVLISTEVTFGMVMFLMVNVVLMSGRVYAAWIDSREPHP